MKHLTLTISLILGATAVSAAEREIWLCELVGLIAQPFPLLKNVPHILQLTHCDGTKYYNC
jgi:uncharacterized membrane protein YjdF